MASSFQAMGATRFMHVILVLMVLRLLPRASTCGSILHNEYLVFSLKPVSDTTVNAAARP